MVFASLLVAGLSTLAQVRRVGLVGAGSMLPMFTAAFSIPFCISAGMIRLASCGCPGHCLRAWPNRYLQMAVHTEGHSHARRGRDGADDTVHHPGPQWRPVCLPHAPDSDALGAHIAALSTLAVVSALILRGSAVMRLWGPIIGIVAGCAVAAGFGLYDAGKALEAGWVGVPDQWPGLGWPP